MTHKIPVSVASLQPSLFEGWATKQGGGWKSWKRRWFVIKGDKIWYFAGKNDTFAKGYIDLPPGTQVKDMTEPNQKKRFVFSIQSRGVKGEREFLIYVESETDLKGFLKACHQVLHGNEKKTSQLPPCAVPPSNVISQPQPPPPVACPQQNDPFSAPPPPQANTYTPPPQSSVGVNNSVGGGGGGDTYKLTIPNVQPAFGLQGVEYAVGACWINSNQPEGVLDFFNVWKTSLPEVKDLVAGESAKFNMILSSEGNKVRWRVSGPQAALTQKMVDFFWNVGAPESEIDKLNDLGAETNPQFVGSWIDESREGGMDGGWFFPIDCELYTARSAGDEGPVDSALNKLMNWAESHGITNVIALGRDMSSNPPRQTTYEFKISGPNQMKLKLIQEAFSSFGFPEIDDQLKDVILIKLMIV